MEEITMMQQLAIAFPYVGAVFVLTLLGVSKAWTVSKKELRSELQRMRARVLALTEQSHREHMCIARLHKESRNAKFEKEAAERREKSACAKVRELQEELEGKKPYIDARQTVAGFVDALIDAGLMPAPGGCQQDGECCNGECLVNRVTQKFEVAEQVRAAPGSALHKLIGARAVGVVQGFCADSGLYTIELLDDTLPEWANEARKAFAHLELMPITLRAPECDIVGALEPVECDGEEVDGADVREEVEGPDEYLSDNVVSPL